MPQSFLLQTSLLLCMKLHPPQSHKPGPFLTSLSLPSTPLFNQLWSLASSAIKSSLQLPHPLRLGLTLKSNPIIDVFNIHKVNMRQERGNDINAIISPLHQGSCEQEIWDVNLLAHTGSPSLCLLSTVHSLIPLLLFKDTYFYSAWPQVKASCFFWCSSNKH